MAARSLLVRRLCRALLLLILLPAACRNGRPTVVVYTSLDQVFSEPVLKRYAELSGVEVLPVYDVEAVKTTGLVTRLAAERDRPRADVFWSSEVAQTIRLQQEGLLEAYHSPSARDIPGQFKDETGFWTGFACRARVLIVNTEQVPREAWPRSLQDLLKPEWEGRAGIANPLFGTTATHAAALHAAWGAERAREFWSLCAQRGVRILDGNSVVRDQVADGRLQIGLTDTDDAQASIERGDPVAMIYPDQGENEMGTLVIPNTVALIRGAPHPEEARKLVDFLLSPEVEAMLAASGSLQIPTRAAVPRPEHVPSLQEIRAMPVSYPAAAAQFPEAMQDLRSILLR